MKRTWKSTENSPKFALFDCKAEQDEMNNKAMSFARTKYDRHASKKFVSTCSTPSSDITTEDYR
jgi:hypothetical protein